MTFRATNCLPLNFVHRLAIAVTLAIGHAICPGGSSASASDVQAAARHAPIDGAASGQTREELIIVAVDASSPEIVDEEIAQTYKLQVVRRLVMSAMGLRIISYSVAGGQPVAEVIARLRADSRITSAQVNVVYRPVPPVEAGGRLTSIVPEPRPDGISRKRQRPTEPRLSSEVVGGRAAPKQGAAKIGEAPPIRIAADVLAGGL